MNLKAIICYLKAIPLYFKTGVWCPHVYKEISKTKGIVITNKNSFRISDNLQHYMNEKVYPNAVIIKNKCIYCNHEDISWYDREPFVIKTNIDEEDK